MKDATFGIWVLFALSALGAYQFNHLEERVKKLEKSQFAEPSKPVIGEVRMMPNFEGADSPYVWNGKVWQPQ